MGAQIAVFAYDRPNHLALTLAHLRACSDLQDHAITLFLDAPARPTAQAGTDAVLAVASDFAEHVGARVVRRPSNLRFGNIKEGITELCQKEGAAIVLEDDVLVSPDFLQFMQAGLDHYRYDERVWMVSGTYLPGLEAASNDVLFLPGAFIWGWATWQRAWQQYQPDPREHADLIADRASRRRFNLGSWGPNSRYLRQAIRGGDTWDLSWHATMVRHNGLALHHKNGLAWNCGTGGGTHYRGISGMDAQPDQPASVPWVHGKLGPVDFEGPRAPLPWRFPEPRVAPEGLDLLARHLRRQWWQKRLSFTRKLLRRTAKPTAAAGDFGHRPPG